MALSTRTLTSVRHRRLRAAAGLYFGARGLLVMLVVMAPIAYFGWGWSDWRVAGVAGGAVGLIFMIAHLVARPLRCGACGQPSLRHTGKAKHAYAEKWLGLSYRARVAWDVITMPTHSCMYCHTRLWHRGRARGAESLEKFPAPAILPGLSPADTFNPEPRLVPPAGATAAATITDEVSLAGGAQNLISPPGVAGVSSLAVSSGLSLPTAPAGFGPSPRSPAPVQPIPAMTPSAPFPPHSPESFISELTPPLPGIPKTRATSQAVPPLLPVVAAPDVVPMDPPKLDSPMAANPPVLPPVAPLVSPIAEAGGNPFANKAAASPDSHQTLPVVAGVVPPPFPAMAVPILSEPSSFFAQVRPPATSTPAVPPPVMPSAGAAAPIHGQSIAAAAPVLPPTVVSPFSAQAPAGAKTRLVPAAPIPEASPAPDVAGSRPGDSAWVTDVLHHQVPPPQPGGPVAPLLPQSMEAVIAALQHGQKNLEVAFQSVISQLRTVMDQMAALPPGAGQVPVVSCPVASPVSAVSSPLGLVPPVIPQMPGNPFQPGSVPGIIAQPSAENAPALPPAQPATPFSEPAPIPSPTGFRVYPPLHPVSPPVAPPVPPQAPAAPLQQTVPGPLAASSNHRGNPPDKAPAGTAATPPADTHTPEPVAPSRRRPLPSLPKILLEELGPTLAQAFAPAGGADLLVDSGTAPQPATPPVLPLAPLPFPPLPAVPPSSFPDPSQTAAVPPLNPEAALFNPAGFAVPAGNSFMPVPPQAGTGPVPPVTQDQDQDQEHPAVPAPFSFLQPVQPSSWPSDDLPALPLSEDPPMWTRTRGKPSLS